MSLERFQQLIPIHEGGQAVVYRAVDPRGQAVVLKVLRGPYPSAEQIEAFRQEARITAAVQGDGVIDLLKAHVEHAPPFLVLEDIGARSLDEAWRGPAPVSVALQIATALVTTLSRVHEAYVIHKDISPANVLWSPEREEVRLIDFGIASSVSRERPALANPTALRGTLAYIAPEQTGRMNRSVDYRSDYYALGATLYRLLAGAPPFPGDDPLELVHAHVAREPRPLTERNPAVSPGLAGVVARLTAKNPEDRYQSAYGILKDLERAGAEPDFTPGAHDRPIHVQIPERLYGREPETVQLLAAFRRVAAGAREVVLIDGYSGVGKTSLVHELHRPMSAGRGVFLSGKCDQFQRGLPYAALARAFGPFCLQILTGSDASVAAWRDRLRRAGGENVRLLVERIPELGLVLGEDLPAPSQLSGADAELVLQLLFARLVGALSEPDRPLVVFLDDLQWADRPTLGLLQHLAADPSSSHLLLIGAWRDNEVDAAHPLTAVLGKLDDRGVPLHRVHLEALHWEAVWSIVADALRSSREDVEALARVCERKTGGNPFFLTRFLDAIEDQGLLTFSQERGTWSADLDGIRGLAHTDNVLELMASRLRQLPEPAQRLLGVASIVGGRGPISLLARIAGDHEDAVLARLAPTVHEQLVTLEERAGDSRAYSFVHDRVQQAAYSLLPEDRRRALHLSIARHLASQTEDLEADDVLFTVAGHLNEAGEAVPEGERREVAQLNLAAARRASTAAAYGAALDHAAAGLRAVGQRDARLRTELELERASALYLLRRFDECDAAVSAILDRDVDAVQRARAFEVRLHALLASNKSHESIRAGVAALGLFGLALPESPTLDDVGAAMAACGASLEASDLAALAHAPELTDPRMRIALRILVNLAAPAYMVTPLLMPLIATNIVTISLEHGVAPETGYGFALYGLVLCSAGHLDAGYGLGQLGFGLTDRFPHHRREKVRAGHVFNGFVRHWKEPVRDILEPYEALFPVAADGGDFEYAGFIAALVDFLAFESGQELPVIEARGARFNAALRVFEQDVGLLLHGMVHQSVLNLMGRSDDPLLLVGEVFDEAALLPVFRQIGDPTSLFLLHFFKTVLAFTLNEWDRAWELATETAVHEPAGGTATFHLPLFFTERALLGLWRGEQDPGARETAEAARAKVVTWAESNPANLAHKVALMDAEWARVDGTGDPAKLYERAIELAEAAGFLQDEGLANELAGRFYLADGRRTIAQAFLREARYAYQRWGAVAKVRQLDLAYPDLLASMGGASGRATSETSLGSSWSGGADLDVEAVLRASQAISSELVLSKLVRTLVTIGLRASGASRAVLLLARDGGFVVAARGTSKPEVEVEVPQEPLPTADTGVVPLAVLQLVQRTGAQVVSADARRDPLFADDAYVGEKAPRSILALPVVHQGALNAVLYLENDQAAGVFAQPRQALARVLLAQAAIALENASLYASLEDKVRERTAELLVARNEAESAREQSEALLRNVLPERIADELKRDGAARPVRVESATVMFTDFAGFTALSAELTPEELVDELEDCFADFDAIMDRVGVEKLKTIGDAYMAVGGVPEPNRTHPVDAVLAALAVLDSMERPRGERGPPPFAIRIGIHTGALVAGVIGKRRFAYDVWGGTVNTASRMESTGVEGRINISADTWELARHLFECTDRGVIAVKGMEPRQMFFVERILPQYAADDRGRVPNEAFRRRLAELTGDGAGA